MNAQKRWIRYLQFSLPRMLLFVVLIAGCLVVGLQYRRQVAVQRILAEGILIRTKWDHSWRTRDAEQVYWWQVQAVQADETCRGDAFLMELWRLPYLEQVEILPRVLGSPITDTSLLPLVHCRALRSLKIGDPGMTDNGLAIAESLPNVRCLAVSGRFSMSGLEKLRAAEHISELTIYGELTGSALGPLSQLSELAQLEIHASREPQNLSGLLQVRRLTLLSPTDVELRTIPKNGLLKELVLVGVSDEALGSMELPLRLRRLSIVGGTVNDDGVRTIGDLHELEMLSLDGCRLSDRELSVIGKLDGLRTVNLSRNSVTEHGIAQLGRLKDLEELYLAETAVADGIWQQLESWPSLSVLDLSGTDVVSVEWSVLKQLKSLRVLVVFETQCKVDGDRLRLETPALQVQQNWTTWQ